MEYLGGRREARGAQVLQGVGDSQGQSTIPLPPTFSELSQKPVYNLSKDSLLAAFNFPFLSET